MSVDAIGDFLTIIRNGMMSSKACVVAPYSKIKYDIARILKDEGFVRDVQIIDAELVKKSIKVVLKYVDGESVIHEIKRMSVPSRRYYVGASKIKPVIGGLGISILTTSKGIMTDKKARSRANGNAPLGGEVICTVW